MIGYYDDIDEQSAPAISQNHVREWAKTYFDICTWITYALTCLAKSFVPQ